MRPGRPRSTCASSGPGRPLLVLHVRQRGVLPCRRRAVRTGPADRPDRRPDRRRNPGAHQPGRRGCPRRAAWRDCRGVDAPGHPTGRAARDPASAKVRKSGRLGGARHMIAAEGLAAVGQMITRYRGGGRFTSDYEIARITVALRDLRVRDDAWARMDPAHADAHLRLWIDVVRRAQPGHVAAPAALLALASSRQHQVMARRDPYHRSTRLRCSPSAMTQARSGAVRSAAGQTYTVIKPAV